jgi:N-acetyl-anhydromuramyl-L-alanine amidase AmpD
MREDHIARGFGGVAYHIFIQPDGEAIITRPFNEKGYHVSKHNEGSIGICLAGNDKFTQRQFDALRYKLDSIFLTYNIKKTELFVHAQFDTAIKQGKTCPNIRINDLLLWYYNTVGEQAIANYIYKES